jgi:Reverse transcriptase (RNA-dependent DNA polymerase).
MMEVLVEMGNFNIGSNIISKVRFKDDTAIIAKTHVELQNMVNRLVDTGRKYGIQINVDRVQVMRVSRRNALLQIKLANREL